MRFGRIGSFVYGENVESGSETALISPVDGSQIASLVLAKDDTVKAAVEAAQTAFDKKWSKTSISERQKLLTNLV